MVVVVGVVVVEEPVEDVEVFGEELVEVPVAAGVADEPPEAADVLVAPVVEAVEPGCVWAVWSVLVFVLSAFGSSSAFVATPATTNVPKINTMIIL